MRTNCLEDFSQALLNKEIRSFKVIRRSGVVVVHLPNATNPGEHAAKKIAMISVLAENIARKHGTRHSMRATSNLSIRFK